MSLYDYLHRLFNGEHGGNVRPPERDERDTSKKFTESLWDFEGDQISRVFTSLHDFKTMTDPLEINRIFEQRMNEMMSAFFSPQGFADNHKLNFFEPNDIPAVEENNTLRDFYLKPGVDKGQKEKSGSDMSGDILPPVSPGQQDGYPQPRTFTFFSSRMRKTVTLPDGTVKTEEVFHNSDGTEERTESHTIPDGTISPDVDSSDLIEIPSIRKLIIPDMKIDSPKDYFLKPGYEKLKPNEEKIDKDLDKQILQSGFESLPVFTKESFHPKLDLSFKTFSRKTVTLPNGVIESEEIVRNSDGTEQRTVTQTLPDGTSTVVPSPQSGLLIEGLKKHQMEEKQSVTLMGVKYLLDMLFK